jgi:hypothetical protein
MLRSNPVIDRFFKFFALPKCYLELIKLKECTKTPLSLALDLLDLFFSYKTFPNNYAPCRLWEVEKKKWKYYYGSNYQSHQKARLLRTVQPREYVILFDDKLICERLCKEIGISTPVSYGIIRPDEDYKQTIESLFHEMEKDTLFIKPLRACGGRGIILARKCDDKLFIQSKTNYIPLSDFNLMETSIVQEVIEQHPRLAEFSANSVNTSRIVTMYTKNNEVIILAATIRFGIGQSYVDNVSSGGISVGVDKESGRLKKYAHDYKGKKYLELPDSKIIFEGFTIPEWTRMVDMAIEVQKSFPCYRILGMDIALTENGDPVLVEVNDAPDLLGMEFSLGPLLQDEQILKAFGDYDLLVNRYQKALYRSLLNHAVS